MTRERNELKAGAFIIITLVLVIAVIVWINGASIGPMQTRTVSFKLTDNIGGLRVGDDVRLGGFKVGVIRSITPSGLDTADPRLLVTFNMPASYVIHPNATIGLESSLTGAANLNIDSPGTGSPARSRNVGARSRLDTNSSGVIPALIPGPFAISGTFNPGSYMSLLS